MAQIIPKTKLRSWILRNGGELLPRKASGHEHFRLRGAKITMVAHGPKDLSKKHVGMIFRVLESLGFDPEQVRREL